MILPQLRVRVKSSCRTESGRYFEGGSVLDVDLQHAAWLIVNSYGSIDGGLADLTDAMRVCKDFRTVAEQKRAEWRDVEHVYRFVSDMEARLQHQIHEAKASAGALKATAGAPIVFATPGILLRVTRDVSIDGRAVGAGNFVQTGLTASLELFPRCAELAVSTLGGFYDLRLHVASLPALNLEEVSAKEAITHLIERRIKSSEVRLQSRLAEEDIAHVVSP